MGYSFIIDLDAYTLMNPAELFGRKDSKRIMTACSQACYYRLSLITPESEVCKLENENPISKEKCIKNFDRQFNIIYGIAHRHNLFIEWYSYCEDPCCGIWMVYKRWRCIACILCF